MRILVDTPIWSLAFRKKGADDTNDVIIRNLIDLIQNDKIAIIGSIRQEVLSGMSNKDKFYEIKNKMSVFSDYSIQTNDYEFAAECSNECRRNGIQGSHTDFLICAVSIKNGWEIFTEDADFLKYKKHIPIRLYTINNGVRPNVI